MSEQPPPDDQHVPPPGLPPSPDTAATTPPPTAPPPRRRGAIVAAVVAALLVLGAAGGAIAYLKLRGAPGAVLDKVPAGADVVFVAHLDPAASQKTNLFRMTERFPDLGTREELIQRVNEMVDQALVDAGLSHDDLDWIGGEVGGYVEVAAGMPAYAVILAVDDEGAAEAALQRLREAGQGMAGTTYSPTTIGGVEVWVASSPGEPATAVFDGVAVLGSDENTMQSVIDTANGASSIQDDAVFGGVMDRLPQDNLGFAYVNIEQLVSLLSTIPAGLIPNLPSTSGLEGLQGAGFSVAAEPDGLAVDSVVTTDPSKLTPEQRDALAAGNEPTPLLSLMPADAYAVVAVNGAAGGGGGTKAFGDALDQIALVDPSAARALQRLHLAGPGGVLSHLTGDLAIQVGPGAGLLPVGGTVAVGIDDRDAVSAWLDRYVPLLLRQADVPVGVAQLSSEDHSGVTITSFGGRGPLPFAWAVLDDALVVGVSSQAVAEAIDLSQGGDSGISTDPGYSAAIAGMPSAGSVLYVDVQAILSVVQGLMPADQYQAFLDAGGRNLQPVEAIVAGTSSDENGSTSRLLIRIP